MWKATQSAFQLGRPLRTCRLLGTSWLRTQLKGVPSRVGWTPIGHGALIPRARFRAGLSEYGHVVDTVRGVLTYEANGGSDEEGK